MCPFGFGGDKKEEGKKEGEGVCPFGFGGGKEEKEEEREVVVSPSSCPFTAFVGGVGPIFVGITYTCSLLLLD